MSDYEPCQSNDTMKIMAGWEPGSLSSSRMLQMEMLHGETLLASMALLAGTLMVYHVSRFRLLDLSLTLDVTFFPKANISFRRSCAFLARKFQIITIMLLSSFILL
ncbi:hypothetical protein BJX64DRAFT_1400 [Aspergillus heterothallicus]